MTTINTDIYDALMSGVNAAVTGIRIAWENDGFTPNLPVPFCRASVLPRTVEPASLGLDGYNEHQGTVLLDFHYPVGTGPAVVLAKIDEVLSILKRGVVVTSGTAQVRLESVWRVPPVYGKAWVQFPVQIRWRCHAVS